MFAANYYFLLPLVRSEKINTQARPVVKLYPVIITRANTTLGHLGVKRTSGNTCSFIYPEALMAFITAERIILEDEAISLDKK